MNLITSVVTNSFISCKVLMISNQGLDDFLFVYVLFDHVVIDDYATDGGEAPFTKMHYVLITNP